MVISSGGGWHCYWLLPGPILVDDDNRRRLQTLQRRWVDFIGGDPAAKDLARVLRVPGSYNNKPEYRTPQEVYFIRFEKTQVYWLEELETFLPPLPPEETTRQPATPVILNLNTQPQTRNILDEIDNPRSNADIFREIRARLPIRALVPGPYYPQHNGVGVHCVFPQNHKHGDLHPSAWIDEVYQCYHCSCVGKGMDIINLWQALTGCSTSETVKQLRAVTGV